MDNENQQPIPPASERSLPDSTLMPSPAHIEMLDNTCGDSSDGRGRRTGQRIATETICDAISKFYAAAAARHACYDQPGRYCAIRCRRHRRPPIYQHIGSPYTVVNGRIIPASVYHGFAHQEPDRQDEGPSAQYWLGTDDIGRDLLARLMQGMLISVSVALVVEIVDVLLGITIGVLAGYYGGWIDQFLARFTDLMFAFPGLLFVILLVGILGVKANQTLGSIPIIGPNGNARLLLVSVALAFTVWPLMARYVRGQTLQLKEQQFVEAARTAGTSDFQIILRHIRAKSVQYRHYRIDLEHCQHHYWRSWY